MPSLKDRLAGVAAKNAPTLTPGKVAPPPKREVEVLPDMREVIGSANDRQRLIRLVGEHLELRRQEKELKDQKEPITKAIKEILGRNEAGKLMVDGNRVNYFSSSRSSIKSNLLLEHGVGPDVIDACTVKTESYVLKVTAPGEKDDDY